jgi:hypothetical protein
VRGKAGLGWLGRVGQRAKAESRGREGEQRQRKRKESRAEQSIRVFWKENGFQNFVKDFPVKLQTFFFNLYFTTKQTPANDENILRKIFYIETNGVLNFGAKIINFSFI